MLNIENALKIAGKLMGNDKVNKAIEMSKSVKSPQDAVKVLSQLGDPNQIINNGMDKLSSPAAHRVASMFGATDQELESLKNEILGLKQVAPQESQKPSKNTKNSRIQELLNGLK